MGASGGLQTSDPTTKSPFGNLPFEIAGGNRRGFSGPLAQGFGFGAGRNYDRFQRQLATAQGPTAEFIRQGQEFLPGYLPAVQQMAAGIGQQGQAGFDALSGQVNQFLAQLPNFQALMGNANQGLQSAQGYAQQSAEQAFSPIQSQALYQQAAGNALDPMRQGAAARGLLDSGAAQQSETDALTDLASQFAMQQRNDQLNATAGLTNAGLGAAQGAGAAAQLAGMGPEAQAMLYNALPQLFQSQQMATQLPFEALSNIGSFLQAQQNPSMALLQMVAPVVGNSSKGFNQSAGISG
jgi:hypothetical protein